MRTITLRDVEYITHSLAKKLMARDEPIPAFSSRYPRVLESCLASPFQKFSKKYLYRGLVGKAAALFYLMIKNHPFENGNKRIAVTTLLHLLYINKRWLTVDHVELYHFAKWVAASNPKVRNETVLAIQTFIRTFFVTL